MKGLKSLWLGSAAIVALACACTEPATTEKVTEYTGAVYENETYAPGTDSAKVVKYFTLKNAAGMEVTVTNFGGRIVKVLVPDKDGNFQDVVLGFDDVESYFPYNNTTDFGASIGRYANRIQQGKIVVDEDTIQLPQNNFGHCLHGGFLGYQYQVYDVEDETDNSITFLMVSPDGDNNFPGEVTAHVNMTVTEDNAIEIKYEATTDKKTVINMTNHSYFNLNGDPTIPVTNHILTLNADEFTPVDSTYMTTGEKTPVEGTPMDFRAGKELGQDIKAFDFEQIKFGNGFDHNWVLNTKGDASVACASLYSPLTGIKLDVFTTEPGIQAYSGNFLDGTVTGKGGIVYNQHAGMCLETQKYPDSPNKQWEESNAYVEPGQTYTSYCKYQFSVVAPEEAAEEAEVEEAAETEE